MSEKIIIELSALIILGIGAQWLAWRLKLPSILFLLVFGFVAGPLSGFLHPDRLMGDLLLPFVSLAVAVILFEGGLTLNLKEFRQIGKALVSLVSVGVVITWVIVSAAGVWVLGMELKIAVLLGAILVVTGPTVIGPLLRHIRPTGKVAGILKWEGIVIDPIGALLAVLVFEAIAVGEVQQAGTLALISSVKTILFGGLSGYFFAWLVISLLKRYWIPDFLHETVTLSAVVASYMISNHFQAESGLFATTLMGIVMANQKKVSIKHILHFKENLRVLIISILFIILSARLDLAVVSTISISSILFLAILIFVARPLAVFVSTLKARLTTREKVFLSWMAPRGIVAAAISSVFALRLDELGIPGGELLVPFTFIVIVGTVTVYGLTSAPLARMLSVAKANPQGVLFVGAHPWALEMAKMLKSFNFKVLLVDTNRSYINRARKAGITALHGSILSEVVLDDMPLEGIGRVISQTSNDEVNSLASLHLNDLFDREELYQLPPKSEEAGSENTYSPKHLRGRYLYASGMDYTQLTRRVGLGAVIQAVKLTREFDYAAFKKLADGKAVPLFIVTESKNLVIVTADRKSEPLPGQILIALVDKGVRFPE